MEYFRKALTLCVLCKAYFLLLIISQSTCTTTVSCIKIPKSTVPTDTSHYAIANQSERNSYGIEKFPQDIWEKYILNTSEIPWVRRVVPSRADYGEMGMEVETRRDFKNLPFNFSLQVKAYALYGRNTYTMDTNTNDLIRGWWRVELSTQYHLELSDQKDEQGATNLPITKVIKSFILVATDEQYNHVGQFTLDFPHGTQKCPQNDATKHMIIPCSAVSPYDAIVPNMIMWVRNDTGRGRSIFPTEYRDQWPIVRNIGSQKTLNFYFKLAFHAAQRAKYKELYFRIVADLDDGFDQEKYNTEKRIFVNGLMMAGMQMDFRAYHVYGAPDALPNYKQIIDCTARIWNINYANLYSWEYEIRNLPPHRTPWYIGSDEMSPYAQYLWSQKENSVLLQHMDMRQGYPDCLSNNYFGGRCYTTRCGLSKIRPFPMAGITNPPSLGNIPLVHSQSTAKECGIFNCNWVRYTAFQVVWGSQWNSQWGFPNELWCVPEYHNQPPNRFYNSSTQTFFHPLRQIAFMEKAFPYNERCNKTEEQVGNSSVILVRRMDKSNQTQTRISKKDYEEEKEAIRKVIRKEAEAIKNASLTRRDSKEFSDNRGVKVHGFGTILYNLRKGHGVQMVVVSMFALPLSIFTSRYYKETCMKTRFLYTPPWFQIHIHLSFWICAMYFAGTIIAICGKTLLGVSITEAGSLHRKIGWFTLIIFMINILGGGIRFRKLRHRYISITVHWALGWLNYFLNVFTIITSVFIPGSPSASRDESITNDSEYSNLMNRFFIPLGIWLVYEICMHISMTVLIYSFDRHMFLTRPRKYVPPVIGVPIPVLKGSAEYDAPGTGGRLVILLIHTFVTGSLTAAAAALIISNTANEIIGFGPMTCTHKYSLDHKRYSIPKEGIHLDC